MPITGFVIIPLLLKNTVICIKKLDMTQHIVYTIHYKPCVVKGLKIVFRRGVAPENAAIHGI